MNDAEQSTSGTDRDETLVRVHQHIGKEGVIVELRTEDHPAPFERDMQHLTESEALDLCEKLARSLHTESGC